MARTKSVSIFLLLLCFSFATACCAETVMLDFSSSSCGPCRQMQPIVRELAAAGYKVRDVNIEREPQLAAQFRVTQVPTFIVLVDGREAARLTGTTSFAQLEQMMVRSSAASPTQAPIVPLGSSPDQFAAQTGPPSNSPPAQPDLSVPQPGRILELTDPNPPAQRAPRAASNPFGQASTRQAATNNGSAVDVNRLIEATVKVAVRDPDGTSAGTGTIVDARSGEALILTCGHLFRSSTGKGEITVSLFQAGPTGAQLRTSVPGHLIDYDLERDLALVSIRTEVPLRSVAIGASATALQPGISVTTVGCNNGQNPTAIASRITTIDRYQGHPNVEVAGAPVEGRSGGGLFNAQGQLIGVCYAADPQANEGLYASLPSIHAKLDSLKLTMVYQPPGDQARSRAANTVLGQNAIATPPPSPAPLAAVSPGQTPPQSLALSPAEQATLEEIRTRGADSEVICIIRSKSPQGKSEVITLHNASPAFVQALTQGAAAARGPAPAVEARANSQQYR
jgi:thiol-disulfide isomerase/thioredoxin